MRSPVDQVEQRDGQDPGGRSAEIPVEWKSARRGRGPGKSQRHGQNGIGAQLLLVGCAVQVAHGLVRAHLIQGVAAHQLRADQPVDVAHRRLDALAGERRPAVTQLQGFPGTSGGAGRDTCPTPGATGQKHLRLHSGIPAGIENAARANRLNSGGDHLVGNATSRRAVF